MIKMNSKECEEQLKSLVEAWELDEADLNQTDINAIKHLMLENQMQHDTIKTQNLVISDLGRRINKAIEFINQRFNENNYLSCGSVARALYILKGDSND